MIDTVIVSIVIVGHNSRREVEACLSSIYVQDLYKSGRVDIIFIDAGSTDDSAHVVAELDAGIRLVPTHRNLGFSRGNNWALRIARGRYVLLLNPDTEIAPHALDCMVTYLDEHPEVGVVAPQLVFADGTTQSSRRRFPEPVTALVESLRWQRWLNWLPIVQRFYMNDRDENVRQNVDWAVGAALLVRRDVLYRVGLFDESFFMYSEETDLCRRVRQAGWRIVYLPEARVIHHEGKSSQHNLRARNVRFHGSRIRYYAKHHGRTWATIVRAATIAHFTLMLIEETAKFALTSRNRDLRRRQMSMFGSVVKVLTQGFFGDRPQLA